MSQIKSAIHAIQIDWNIFSGNFMSNLYHSIVLIIQRRSLLLKYTGYRQFHFDEERISSPKRMSLEHACTAELRYHEV